jgi:ABC transporter family protein
VLKGADLEVGPGQLVAVVGENGSGKSTLLRILDEPSFGPMQFAVGGAFARQALWGHLALGLAWAAAFTASAWLSSSSAPAPAGTPPEPLAPENSRPSPPCRPHQWPVDL